VTSVNVGHWYAVNYQKHHLMCTISVLFLVCDVAVTRIQVPLYPNQMKGKELLLAERREIV